MSTGPAQYEYGRLLRVDPDSGEIIDRRDLDGNPSALRAAGDSLVLAMWQFDDADPYGPGRWLLERMDLGSQRTATTQVPAGWVNHILVRGPTTWVAASTPQGRGVVLRVDADGDVHASARMRELGGVALIEDRVWIADMRRDAVVPLDATTLRPAGDPAVTGPQPMALAAADEQLWVSHFGDGSVVRLATP